MQLQAAVFSGVPTRFSARGRALLLQVYREIKPMSLFEAACKCHKQSSVKIRKGTLFLCSILLSTAQNSGSPGPQISVKQDLRGDGDWQGRDWSFLCAPLVRIQDGAQGQVMLAVRMV